MRALAYPDLVGTPAVGDRVLLNVSALERGLGTGGMALVVALPDRLPADPPAGPGHVVKARYTPLQSMVLGVDEQESPHHAALRDADDLGGMPVVVADLHSAVPAVVAGLRDRAPQARVAYVMTDGGALPLAFSRTVSMLVDAGWLASTVTVGQAFGGAHEAVNVHTGLLAAAHVVRRRRRGGGPGPGQPRHRHPVGLLRHQRRRGGQRRRDAGRPARWPRCGSPRPTPGSGTRACRTTASPPTGGWRWHRRTCPCRGCPGRSASGSAQQAAALVDASGGRLRLHEVEVDGLDEALALSPVRLSTMGRGLDRDRASFLAAAAAGRHAASLL